MTKSTLDHGAIDQEDGAVHGRRTRTGPRRAVHLTAWVLSAVLALAMAGGGAAKLFGDPAMLDLFDAIGAGQWLRYVVGFFEVAGAIGLLIPRLRAAAALGLIVLLACATLTNVAILHTNTTLSVLYAAVAIVIFVVRRSELRSTVTGRATE